jgi:hypothetical protein
MLKIAYTQLWNSTFIPGNSCRDDAIDKPHTPHSLRHETLSSAFGVRGGALWRCPAVCVEHFGRRPQGKWAVLKIALQTQLSMEHTGCVKRNCCRGRRSFWDVLFATNRPINGYRWSSTLQWRPWYTLGESQMVHKLSNDQWRRNSCVPVSSVSWNLTLRTFAIKLKIPTPRRYRIQAIPLSRMKNW